MSDNLIARVLPYLPGTLIGGNGIDVVQTGTAYTISWNTIEAGFSTFGLQLGAAANAAAAQALLTATPLSWRNILGPNGGFEVWQRGAGSSASFALAASAGNPYTADRWYLFNGANQATTVAAVTGIVTGSRLACKVQRNNAQTGVGLMAFGFPLDTDECAMIQGQVVALSFTAKAGANWSPASGNLVAQFTVGTGAATKSASGFAGQTTPISATFVLTTSAQRFTIVSSVVPATTTQAEVNFQWTPVGTAGADDSFTVDDVQLEVGASPTSFERWPFERSFLACRRHFWKTFLYGTAPVTNAGVGTGELQVAAGKTTLGGIFPRNPVSMRATPSVTTFNPAAANAAIRDETSAADTTGTAVANSTTEGFQVTATGGIAAAGDTLGVHLTADAGI